MIPYRIDFEELRRRIREKGYRKVLLQLPEGMKLYGTEIADHLDDFETYISTEHCFGACDIVVHEDKLTVQFGHSEIPNIKYPENVIFVESFSEQSFKEVAEKFLKMQKCERIGIVASVQHVKKIEEVREIFEEHGREALVGKGDSRVKYDGQVLGCNFSAARSIAEDVDCFAFLGTGVFHAIGVRIVTDKKTYVLDPYSNEILDVEEQADRLMRQRFGAIVRAEHAERFGIIVSEKIGQRREKLALALKSMVESSGFKAYLLYGNEVNPEEMYYEVDAYVNTACPRVTYDDYLRFSKPVLTPIELQILLKYKLWEDYSFDEIVGVD